MHLLRMLKNNLGKQIKDSELKSLKRKYVWWGRQNKLDMNLNLIQSDLKVVTVYDCD